MAYCAPMPIDDERAAWLGGLRTTDTAIHEALDAEVASREIAALQERITSLHAQVAALQGAVRVRDSLLADHRVAIAERDVRIDALAAQASPPPLSRRVAGRAGTVARRAARVPRRLVRSVAKAAGR